MVMALNEVRENMSGRYYYHGYYGEVLLGVLRADEVVGGDGVSGGTVGGFSRGGR